MQQEKVSIGFMITEGMVHGIWRVMVKPMVRRADDEHPVNPSSSIAYGRDVELALDDLVFTATQADNTGEVYTSEPGYLEPYHVNARRAKAMLAMLTKLEKANQKAGAKEIGDQLMVFAKTIGATWYCRTVPENAKFMSYSDVRWTFLPVSYGREKLREIVKRMETEWIRAHADKVSV